MLKQLPSILPNDSWLTRLEPYGFILAVEEQGSIVRTLQDPGGEVVRGVSSVQEHGEYLYLTFFDDDELW